MEGGSSGWSEVALVGVKDSGLSGASSGWSSYKKMMYLGN